MMIFMGACAAVVVGGKVPVVITVELILKQDCFHAAAVVAL